MTEKQSRQEKIRNKEKANRLLNTPEFFDLILVKFLKESMYEVIYREGASDGVVKEIAARKVFNDFLYAIIDEGTMAEQA